MLNNNDKEWLKSKELKLTPLQLIVLPTFCFIDLFICDTALPNNHIDSFGQEAIN